MTIPTIEHIEQYIDDKIKRTKSTKATYAIITRTEVREAIKNHFDYDANLMNDGHELDELIFVGFSNAKVLHNAYLVKSSNEESLEIPIYKTVSPISDVTLTGLSPTRKIALRRKTDHLANYESQLIAFLNAEIKTFYTSGNTLVNINVDAFSPVNVSFDNIKQADISEIVTRYRKALPDVFDCIYVPEARTLRLQIMDN